VGPAVSGESFRVGDWLIEPNLNRVARDGEVRHLRPRLMDLFVYLAQHAGDLVTKDEILERVWQPLLDHVRVDPAFASLFARLGLPTVSRDWPPRAPSGLRATA
jgi:DNA-binding response OmpR family regulator